jgi:hypothetical protein
MFDPQVMKALIDIAIFLEFSDDRIIDPDAAVSALEDLAANLQMATPETRAELTQGIRSLVGSYPDRVEFVSDLPDSRNCLRIPRHLRRQLPLTFLPFSAWAAGSDFGQSATRERYEHL